MGEEREHLDWWGTLRKEAIQDYRKSAQQAFNEEGDRLGRLRGSRRGGINWRALGHSMGEAAAQQAPHSNKELGIELATMAIPIAAKGVAKLMGIGKLYETVHEARTARAIVNLNRQMVLETLHAPALARSLGRWRAPKEVLSAITATAHSTEAIRSILHSGKTLARVTPEALREGRNWTALKTPGQLHSTLSKQAHKVTPAKSPRQVSQLSVGQLHHLKLNAHGLGHPFAPHRPVVFAHHLHVSPPFRSHQASTPAFRLKQPHLRVPGLASRPHQMPLAHSRPSMRPIHARPAARPTKVRR